MLKLNKPVLTSTLYNENLLLDLNLNTILAAAGEKIAVKFCKTAPQQIVTHVESSNVYPRLPFKIDLRCHQN
jgi:hypothetical protein